jgi:hypothetical protein
VQETDRFENDGSRLTGIERQRDFYSHRVAISNHRLASFADGQVTFRCRDSADHNKQKLLTLPVDEFLRSFLLHLLPEGFVRIRNFGFLANRQRATLHSSAALLSVARRGTRAASRTTRFLHRRLPRSLALSHVWWPDEDHRKAHRV